MFENKKIIIATKHGKEKIFEKVLQSALKGKYFAPNDFDTDEFGSFSGDIERTLTAKETVKQKCLAAMQKYNLDIALASEGSFGNHPMYYFTPFNEEWVVLIDLKNDLEIYGVHRTTEVCYEKKSITNWNALKDFLKQIDFPHQNVIIKNKEEEGKIICKDALTYEQIKQSLQNSKITFPIYIETDLRAMHNPTRIKSIEKAIENLLQNIQSVCPKCYNPGFVITQTQSGLPCVACGLPTKNIAYTIKNCRKCSYELKEKINKEYEEPQFCDFCNP